MKRFDVTFASGPNACAGWLYEPAGPPRRTPLVVLGHGLGATRDMGLDAYAERFCDAGYRALAFDYRHFGDSEGEPRQLLDLRRQIDDWTAAVHYARSLPRADPDRIVLWGTSLAGGLVISVAARDARVAAVISQCPLTHGTASALRLGMLSATKVLLAGLRDVGAHLSTRAPATVRITGARGDAALMVAPDAKDGYAALVPVGHTHPDTVSARAGLTIPLYAPGRTVKDVACPMLFCVCDKDAVTPARVTRWYARRARDGELRRYDVGHFDIYHGEPFESAVADQLDFLRRRVPLG
ncbi:alpha/beta hydrolase [Solicola gregarius]|uniref:Alpha/beta fold hydrolase n=1 Tax=Solicola gregarius TaxID=2908642 RepID=A0AA46TLR4_9ACTN|nr:alpha/beta fold hydrolase [Solicola gregarius]UYM07606.1 alpha/beta fold hydrolase [Solicola gregarius]